MRGARGAEGRQVDVRGQGELASQGPVGDTARPLRWRREAELWAVRLTLEDRENCPVRDVSGVHRGR